MGMKTPLVSKFFLFCFIGFSSLLVNSQSDSCSSNLNIAGIPFDTTSLNCQSVWSSQDYILRYEQQGPSLWNFILSAPNTNSYVAIGFSPDGNMVGSSSIVGWVPSDGNAVIKQYYLGGMDSNSCTPDSGDLKVANMTILSLSSRLYLCFQLNIDQPKSNLIYAVGPESSLPSSPDYLLSQHQSKTTASLIFVSGKSTTTSSTTQVTDLSPGDDTQDTGGLGTSNTQDTSSGARNTLAALSILGWVLLMIIG
ncbi:PREDICTED: cytochrome b561 and DOMON domain-containing protein At3g07570-like [Nelumbo nucifera]|uniref:Cytochrome b561 and DOMON domain-containing protein At3g07570-like n=1 Tax=Nelumbo nucifera TaxID=4432 RepID=A0A1U8AYS3_NELNU|nr:PREDICTED: cytochrome b561 and DOMON domain-containing protein At3g07570-like [Nelumbo nucifera]